MSDWVVVMRERPQDEKAHKVIRQLGSNSIPLLLDWLRKDDKPTFQGRVAQSKQGMISFLESHRFIEPRPRSLEMDWKSSYRSLGNAVLSELGPEGKAAIPTLIQMLGDKNHKPDEVSQVAGVAWLILPRMAPESIPPLICALTNQDTQVWCLAAGALGHIGSDAKAAIPFVKEKLKDKDPYVRVGAADIIGKLGGNPDEFVPTLIGTLPEVEWDYLNYALEVLVRYKNNAKPAVPVLLDILNKTPNSTNTTNTIVRSEVLSALREIDPEAAAKVGVK